MSGLLYQLNNLGGSFEDPTPILIATWRLGIGLSSIIFLVIAGTTVHVLVYQASPFGSHLSEWLLTMVSLMSAASRSLLDRLRETGCWFDEQIRWVPWYQIFLLLAFPIWLPLYLIGSWETDSEESDEDRLFRGFMELIAEASDPKLVERAVAMWHPSRMSNGSGTEKYQSISLRRHTIG